MIRRPILFVVSVSLCLAGAGLARAQAKESTEPPATQDKTAPQETEPPLPEPPPPPPYYQSWDTPSYGNWSASAPVRDPRQFGFRLALGVQHFDEETLYGLGFAFRYRPRPNYAFDFGLGFLQGEDGLNLDVGNIPLTFDVLYFFNPFDTVQFFVKGGARWMWVNREGFESDRGRYIDTTETYLAAQLGGGIEIQFSPVIGLTLELQGIARNLVAERNLYATPGLDSDSFGLGLQGSLGFIYYFY